MRGRLARLVLLGLLPVHLAAQAAGQWQCTPGPDDIWTCSGEGAAPAAPAVGVESTGTETVSPAAVAAPAAAVEKPAQAGGAAPGAGSTPPQPAAAEEIPAAASTPAQPAAAAEMPAAAAPAAAEATAQPGPTAAEATTETEAPTAAEATTETEAPAAAEAQTETEAPAAAETQTGTEAPTGAPAAEPAPAPAVRQASGQVGLPQHALAPDDTWALCPPAPQYEIGEPVDESGAIDLRADNARASGDGNVYTLSGNAVVRQRQQRLAADTIVYRQDADVVEAEGNLRLSSPEIIVEGESGLLHPATELGSLQKITYAIPSQHGRGSADSVNLEGTKRQQLAQVSYTTCPPGNNDWEMFARRLDLDHDTGVATARDARLRVKGIPVLYSPWLTFPFDDRRKSGLLFPRYGHTESTGTDISIPWYWNIAPNRDATITPRIMSERGVMLGGEFRYLNDDNRGVMTGDYLPSDNKFNDKDRSLVSIRHFGNPFPRLDTRINASVASDDYIFEDFGTTLVQTSRTNLQRTAAADYHGDWWDLGVMVRDFQTLDPGTSTPKKPYKQLPNVYFEAAPDARLYGFKFSAEAELDYFKSGADLVEGRRLDLLPRISYPVTRSAWYIEPAFGLRQTFYDLNSIAEEENATPDRTTPITSLDAGTFFDRTGRWGKTDYIQTLEPRLFYLYVPYKAQDDLPVFDTGDYDFNYWTLFRDNRFTGPDRMGDANQLTLALTTRILDPASGLQWLRASLGQTAYFRNRDVTLPGQPVETNSSSDLIGEVVMNLARNWNAGADIYWNPHDAGVERNDYRIQYRPGRRQLVNLSYRYRRDDFEQADFSFLWPLSRSWHAVGRWYYSLQSSELIEAIAGIGYESCCWAVQLVGRNYIKNSNVDRVDEIFLQVELKGLGKLGNQVDDVLERGILDY